MSTIKTINVAHPSSATTNIINDSSGNVAVGANLTFSGTAARITGDMTNATSANRLTFQTSTTNGATALGIIPNGTSNFSGLILNNSSDPDNAAYLYLQAYSSYVAFNSGITGTGTYQPMTFFTGGAERMRIDTSGNVGIGTSAITYKLQVGTHNGYNDQLSVYNDGTFSTGGVNIFNYYNNTTNICGIKFASVSATTGAILFQTNSGSGPTERARIDTSGNFIVGSTSNSGKLNSYNSGSGDTRPLFLTNTNSGAIPNGSIFIDNANSGTSAWSFLQCFSSTSTVQKAYIRGDGNFGSATSVYGGLSDVRIKKDITDATPKLEKLMQVRVVNYVRTDEEGQGKELGVIAQELETVFPGLVYETEVKGSDGKVICSDRKNVKYSVFVPMLIKAIQELSAKNDALEARLAVLEAK